MSTAVVTGANSGIGHALAKLLTQEVCERPLTWAYVLKNGRTTRYTLAISLLLDPYSHLVPRLSGSMSETPNL